MPQSRLVLEDGTVYEGESFGATADSIGEVVFNTSLTGSQAVLTDPSYAGQLVTMTYPLIGNYGANETDQESRHPQVAGFIVRELTQRPSNWRAELPLQEYLAQHGVVGLAGVDTRALTRHIRSAGAMRGAIAPASVSADALLRQIEAHPRMEGLDLTGQVSTTESYVVRPAERERFRVIAYDFGVKNHSLWLLAERGCEVVTVPASTRPEEILGQNPDGLFLSNGPGDPDAVGHALETIQRVASRGTPVFGICLGHQLLARAFGGETYKLLYGHRGGNHPVRRLSDGAVEITAQNHGFAVKGGPGDGISGAAGLRVTHVNLNDGTIEGLRHRELPAFSVQYHPEAAPGPHDSRYLFDDFIAAMSERLRAPEEVGA